MERKTQEQRNGVRAAPCVRIGAWQTRGEEYHAGYQLVKSYAGKGRNGALDGRGGGVNGWGGSKTNRKARFKRIRWKRRKNYQGKVKSPALQNRGQGTQHPKSSQGLSPGHPSAL